MYRIANRNRSFGGITSCLFIRLSMILVLAIELVGASAAVCRAETASAKHPPVTAVAFTPDGSQLVAASQSGLAVYSWPGLILQQTMSSKSENLHALAFSIDGSLLAVAGGRPAEEGLIEVFRWPERQLLATLDGHEDSAMDVCWLSETGLASVGMDHAVIIQRIDPGATAKQRLAGHSRGVVAAASLPEQNLLITAGIDQGIRVWEIGSAELKRNMAIHVRPISAIAVRPSTEGLPMIASASDDSTVRFWQPTIGRMVRFARLPSPPRDLAWLRDGSRIVACCNDGNVYGIDPDTVEVTGPLGGLSGGADGDKSVGESQSSRWAYCIAVHPNDKSVVVGGADGILKRLDDLKID